MDFTENMVIVDLQKEYPSSNLNFNLQWLSLRIHQTTVVKRYPLFKQFRPPNNE